MRDGYVEAGSNVVRPVRRRPAGVTSSSTRSAVLTERLSLRRILVHDFSEISVEMFSISVGILPIGLLNFLIQTEQ